MTSKQHTGDLIAIRSPDHVASLRDVAAGARDGILPAALSTAADLHNVIVFARARRHGAEPSTPPVTIGPEDRPAPPTPGTGAFTRAALLACSLALHGMLLFAFWQEPKPLASIGIEAITVEILVGDNRPAGVSPTPGEVEVQPSEAVEEVKPDEKLVEEDQVRTAEVREVKPVEQQTEVAKEQAVERPKEQQPEVRQEIAMVETPRAVIPTALPRETLPDITAIITPPREQPKEERPVDPKAKPPAPKKAARPAPSVSADAASGSGRRSVASDPNYRGLVAAHLTRHKQYPAAARSNSITGSGTVTFSINGSGGVTSVSVVAGTGASILDQEIAAMVRRASPFPAPPDGQPKIFTVPVRFNLE